jgi:hypothetical protein
MVSSVGEMQQATSVMPPGGLSVLSHLCEFPVSPHHSDNPCEKPVQPNIGAL